MGAVCVREVTRKDRKTKNRGVISVVQALARACFAHSRQECFTPRYVRAEWRTLLLEEASAEVGGILQFAALLLLVIQKMKSKANIESTY